MDTGLSGDWRGCPATSSSSRVTEDTALSKGIEGRRREHMR
jgi:hypothetical protein